MGDAQPHYNATPPAFGAPGDTTVPANVELRYVYGSVSLTSTAVTAANITISICGGAALENFQSAPIASLGLTWGYAFTVTGGTCYRFNDNADPSGNNRISAYNYVDVLNESFESRTHGNATWESQTHANATAATKCPLTDCVNNSWYNRTAPFGDVRIISADHRWGRAWIQYDPSPYVGLGATIYARPSSSDSFVSEGDASQGQFVTPRPIAPRVIPCPITAEAYIQGPSGDVTPTIQIPVPCDQQYQHNITYVEATSHGANVTVTWQSDATSLDGTCVPGPGCTGAFEVFGGSTPDDPTQWNGVWWPWEFEPDWYCGSAPDPTNALCLTGTTRSVTGPLSDFVNPTGTTYLSVHLQGNGETGEYDVTSCVLAFVADGSPHSCGTLAPAAPAGNVTFINQTVNASGESFLPVLFGVMNDNAGMGDNFASCATVPCLPDTGTQFNVLTNPTAYIVSPFPLADPNRSGGIGLFPEDDVFTMTRNGTFLTADIRAIGPYEDAGDGTAAPSTEDVSLLVELQKNNVTVGSASWAPGEVSTKSITITSGAFVAGDNYRWVLTPSNTAPTNTTFFNLVEATYGILWAGNATSGGGNVTVTTVTSFDFTSQFFAGITLAKFIIMLLAFAAFIWVSRMHWYEMAAWSWLIIIQQLFLGDTPFGPHATFIGLVVLWLVNLFLRIILAWRDDVRQGRLSQEARPNRGRGG